MRVPALAQRVNRLRNGVATGVGEAMWAFPASASGCGIGVLGGDRDRPVGDLSVDNSQIW